MKKYEINTALDTEVKFSFSPSPGTLSPIKEYQKDMCVQTRKDVWN